MKLRRIITVGIGFVFMFALIWIGGSKIREVFAGNQTFQVKIDDKILLDKDSITYTYNALKEEQSIQINILEIEEPSKNDENIENTDKKELVSEKVEGIDKDAGDNDNVDNNGEGSDLETGESGAEKEDDTVSPEYEYGVKGDEMFKDFDFSEERKIDLKINKTEKGEPKIIEGEHTIIVKKREKGKETQIEKLEIIINIELEKQEGNFTLECCRDGKNITIESGTEKENSIILDETGKIELKTSEEGNYEWSKGDNNNYELISENSENEENKCERTIHVTYKGKIQITVTKKVEGYIDNSLKFVIDLKLPTPLQPYESYIKISKGAENNNAGKPVECFQNNDEIWWNGPVKVEAVKNESDAESEWPKIRKKEENSQKEISIRESEKCSFEIQRKEGNIWQPIEDVEINIDTEAPKIEMRITDGNNALSPIAIDKDKKVNVYGKEACLAFKVSDTKSGIKGVSLFEDTPDGKEKPLEFEVDDENEYKYKLRDGAEKKLRLKVKDFVGNINEQPVENGNTIYISATAPNIEMSPLGKRMKIIDGKWWTNEAYQLQCTVTRKGKSELTTTVSGMTEKPWSESEPAQFNLANNDISNIYTYVIPAGQPLWKSGTYKYSAEEAGNISKEKELKVNFDNIPAEIIKFQFGGKGKDTVEEIKGDSEYTYFFKEETKVTIYADDNKDGVGISEIAPYAVGIWEKKDSKSTQEKEEKKTYIFKNTKLMDAGIPQNTVRFSAKTNGKITVTIPAGFKGDIYAVAIDKLDNGLEKLGEKADVKDRLNKAAISETKEIHTRKSGITIKPTKKEQGVLQTGGKRDLFADAVKLNVSVQDTYSGISEAKIVITSGKKTETQTLKIESTGKKKGKLSTKRMGNALDSGDAKWKKGSTDRNLVTNVSKKLQIGGESNDIKVVVSMTDNAGHSSKESYRFAIDKSSPVISVKYDNNKTSGTDKKIYNSKRTATIRIKELNFDEKKVKVSIQNRDAALADSAVPQAGKWRTDAKDSTVHILQYVFDSDGEWQLSVDCADLAENKAQTHTGEAFRIDKTLPTFQVTYSDGGKASNGKYFNKARRATLTIKEHNFKEENVKSSIQVTLNGKLVDAPKISDWSRKGDIHTATIDFQEDGDYKIQFDFHDAAGNKVKNVEFFGAAAREFTIDKTEGTIVVSGLDKGIYGFEDTVQPQIEFSDINYHSYTIKMTRYLLDTEDEVAATDIKEVAHGVIVLFGKIKKKAENDGLYQLEMEVTDAAGNKKKEEKTFVVNRFGTVYVFRSGIAENVNKKYLKTENVENMVIEAYNASEVKTEELIITHNGTPMKLHEDTNKWEKPKGAEKWWHKKYEILQNNFKEDGHYTVSLNTTDNNGNTSTTVPSVKKEDTLKETDKNNIEQERKMNIEFYVDNTAPKLENIIGLEQEKYDANHVDVKFTVYDAAALESVKVFIDDNVIKKYDEKIMIHEKQNATEKKGNIEQSITNSYDGDFTISEKNKVQKISFVVTDKAGNKLDTSARDYRTPLAFFSEVMVTTNRLTLFLANETFRYIFMGGVLLFLVIGGAVAVFIVRRKRRYYY